MFGERATVDAAGLIALEAPNGRSTPRWCRSCHHRPCAGIIGVTVVIDDHPGPDGGARCLWPRAIPRS